MFPNNTHKFELAECAQSDEDASEIARRPRHRFRRACAILCAPRARFLAVPARATRVRSDAVNRIRHPSTRILVFRPRSDVTIQTDYMRA
ncbi:MAG: hypothetical protein ACOY82_10795, partial [Pseudomonadota bacterium]